MVRRSPQGKEDGICDSMKELGHPQEVKYKNIQRDKANLPIMALFMKAGYPIDTGGWVPSIEPTEYKYSYKQINKITGNAHGVKQGKKCLHHRLI